MAVSGAGQAGGVDRCGIIALSLESCVLRHCTIDFDLNGSKLCDVLNIIEV